MNAHPVFALTLRTAAGVAPDATFRASATPAPADVAIARIRELEAKVADLERRLHFKQEAIAQMVAKYEELVPSGTDAELPDGSMVTAPEYVVHDALLWIRDKYDLEWAHRIDEKTLLHFECEKAEARIAAWEDRQ